MLFFSQYRCLCYCVGGSQGDTDCLAPFKCTLPYHVSLHNVQRRHRTTDIVCYLDDTYAHDYVPRLARFYNDKAATCEAETESEWRNGLSIRHWTCRNLPDRVMGSSFWWTLSALVIIQKNGNPEI